MRTHVKPTHWCGAVVISQKFVLTAAHCLTGFAKGSYSIVAGDYNIDVEEGTEQEANIEEFYIHENFRKETKMNNDIALIKLKGKGFTLNSDVQAICLPAASFDQEQGLNCTLSGFGSIQSGKSSKQTRKKKQTKLNTDSFLFFDRRFTRFESRLDSDTNKRSVQDASRLRARHYRRDVLCWFVERRRGRVRRRQWRTFSVLAKR